jgi:hypothetical protein
MYVVAFGVSMSLDRFLAEVAPLFLLPMWPLLLAASVAQVAWLVRVGVVRDRRAWKFGFAVLLSPVLALVVRVVLYLFGIPDHAPFAGPNSTSQYVLTLTTSSLLSTLLAYGALSLATLLGKGTR